MNDQQDRYYDAIGPLYARAFAQFGDDLRSVFTPKGRQSLRYAHMLSGLTFQSVLDVGCGTGLLKAHLNANGLSAVHYTGIDIVEGMVELCRKKFPDGDFHHVHRASQIDGQFDLVLVAGTFNIVPGDFSEDDYRSWVFDTLTHLYARTRHYLVFDFLNDLVDFKQERAFHVSHAEMIAFVTERLSRRFNILQAYMPYEGAVQVFKENTIDRTSNTFASASD